MKTKINIIGLVIITASLNIACNNNPKVITASTENETSDKSSGIFSDNNLSSSNSQVDCNTHFSVSAEIHKIIVNEVLPAAKYV